MMKNLAIITARSGSKGLPDKNIKLLNGKPLIAYTIEAARDSGLFDEIFVSTDSEEYAQISERFGATAHPLRGEHLAGDNVGSIDVILDVLSQYPNVENFALLQPTSPLRDATDIQVAYKIFTDNAATSVISLAKSEKSPSIINQINPDGTIHDFLKIDQKKYARQNSTYYYPNGAIFLSNVAYFISNQDFYGPKSYPYIMNKAHSIDIDDRHDFMLAELIAKENAGSEKEDK